MRQFASYIFFSACLSVGGVLTTTHAFGAKKRAVLDIKERKRSKGQGVGNNQLNRSAVFAVEVERKLIRGIDKTIRYLNKTASQLPRRSSQRLQLLERVLNLQLEQATYVRAEEEREYDKAWQAWNNGGRRGREPKLSTKKSLSYWRSLIGQATAILKEYPRSRNADMVTFNKAVGFQYIGKEKEAARIYTQLTQKYKNSTVRGDAYAALGDYFFDRNDFRNAQANYKEATKYRRSKRFLWAVFKLGWCSYNLGRFKQSLVYWKRVVSIAQSSGAKAASLKEDALRDMVFAFAEVKDIEGAIGYYKQNGGNEYIGTFLTLLAQTLADQGKFDAAVKTLKRFQQEAPGHEDAPTAQKEIISLSFELGRMKVVWAELARFAPLYGSDSAWAKRNERRLVLETQVMIKDQILYYSKLVHQKAIKNDNKRLNYEAKKGYALFLSNYPRSKEVPEVKYLIADIEYFLKDYREAGRQYFEIASLGKDRAVRYDPEKKKTINMHNEVSIAMVDSYAKDFETEFQALKKLKPNFSKPKPLSAKAKNYIKACGNYTQWYPEDKKRVKSCETDIAKIYYHSGNKENAIKYLKALALKYPSAKEGPASVELLIPIFADDKDNLMGLVNDLLKVPAYQKGKLGSRLQDIRRGSEKEQISREKDPLKRGNLFEAQAKKYPNDPEVDKLWFNAAVAYLEAGAVGSAIAAHLVILKRFPKSAQAKESMLKVAQLYDKKLDYDGAAGFYARFQKTYPQDKRAAGAMSRSCELLIAVDASAATANCIAFARKYPDGAKVFIEQLILSAKRQNRARTVMDLVSGVYQKLFKLNYAERIVGQYRIFQSLGGKGAAASRAAGMIIGDFKSAGGKVDGEALRAVGEITYRRALNAVPAFRNLSLQGGTVDRLAASIERKALALKKLEDSFNQVVATKDAYWGVAALYQIGLANEGYAEALSNPPKIQGAPDEAVKKELAPQVADRKKAGLVAYRTALETVSEFNVYNEFALKVFDSAQRLGGGALTSDGWIPEPDFIASEVSTSVASEVK